MRLGLISPGCRVQAPRGVAVSQEVRIGRQYADVAVVIHPITDGCGGRARQT